MPHTRDRIHLLLRVGGCLASALLVCTATLHAGEPTPGSPAFFRQPPAALESHAGAVLEALLPTPVDPAAAAVSEAFRDTHPPADYIHHRLSDHAVLLLPRTLHAAASPLPSNTPVRVAGIWTPSDPLEPKTFALVAFSYHPLRAPAPLPASPYPDGYATTIPADAPLERIPTPPLVRLQTTLSRQQSIPSEQAATLGLGAGAWFRVDSDPSPVTLVYSDHTQGLADAIGQHLAGAPVTVYGRLFTLSIPERTDRTALLIDGLDPHSAPTRPTLSGYAHRSKTIIREVIALPILDTMEIDYVYQGHERAPLALLAHFRTLQGDHVRLKGPEDNFMGDRIDLLLPVDSHSLVAELELAQPGDTLTLRCRRVSGTDLRHALIVKDIQRVPPTHARSP